jgi:hypothetical protein
MESSEDLKRKERRPAMEVWDAARTIYHRSEGM